MQRKVHWGRESSAGRGLGFSFFGASLGGREDNIRDVDTTIIETQRRKIPVLLLESWLGVTMTL